MTRARVGGRSRTARLRSAPARSDRWLRCTSQRPDGSVRFLEQRQRRRRAMSTDDDRALHDHLRRLPRRRLAPAVPRVPRGRVGRRVRRVARRVLQPVPRPAGRRPRPELGRRAPHLRPGEGRPGRRGHVPQHGAAVLPDRRGDRPGAPGRRGLPPPVGRPARPQPLARRLVRALPRPARRHRPDLPRRRRRRDRRGRVDGRPRPARRRAHPRHPRRRATCRRTTRTTTTALWAVCEERGVVVGHHTTGTGLPDYGKYPSSTIQWMIETAWYAHRPLWQLADERRVRALPEPQARAHRAGLRLDPAAAHAARRVPHADAVGSHRRDEPQERPGAAADADASTSSATCGWA